MAEPRHRLLFLTTGLLMGGAETMLCKLLSRIDRRRFDCSVLSLREENALSGRVRELGIPLTHLDWPRGLPTPFGVTRLVREVRRAAPDLVQGWMYHGNLAGAFARRFLPRRVPLAWAIRKSMISPNLERPVTGLVVRLGAPFSKVPEAILYNSQVAREQHERLGYDPSRGLVIPNGFDTSLFHPDASARARVRRELRLGERTPLVGLIGRWHPQKDHANFLQAAAKIGAADPSVTFLMAGTGVEASNRELSRLVERLGPGTRVRLLGERRDIPALNATLDIAVSSSSFGEGFPNVLGEAMACGVPCVATNVGDSSFILGATGKVVPPGDPQGLAQGVLSLLRLPATRRRGLGQKARARVVKSFSLEAVTRSYEGFYARMLATPGGKMTASRTGKGKVR